MADLDLQVILDATQGDGDTATREQRQEAARAALAESGASRDEVGALLDEVVEKFGTLYEGKPTDPESLLGLELLADVASAARQVQTDIDAESERTREVRDGLAAQVLGDQDGETDTAEGDSTDATDDGQGDADTDGDGGTDNTSTDSSDSADTSDDAGAEAGAEREPVAVTAAAKRPRRFNLSRIADRAPAPTSSQPNGVAILAAADVRGFATGQELDRESLVAAAIARIEGMPNGVKGAHVKAGIAQFRNHFPEDLVAAGLTNDDPVIERAVDQTRLTGGSLAASGGWCAPSERLYDLVPLLADPNAGLLSLPEIAVKRGGIWTAGGLDFRTVWAGNAGLIQTEAQAEANTAKNLFRPVCPTHSEKRADVIYSGLEVGFLQDHAYPEVTQQAIEGVMAVHAHRVNASSIARMVALSDDVDLTAAIGPSATGSILNGLGLLITDARYRYRAGSNFMLEVVLPDWLKEVVRSDLALRGGVDFVQVTDEQINVFFQVRKAKVQWVYDWQDAFTGVNDGFGAVTPIEAFPETVDAMVYPAGAFVRGRGEVVNLDTVYDSTNIKKNDYLRLFMEEKLLVHKRGYQSLNVTLPLGVSGTTGTGVPLDKQGRIVVTAPEDDETP